MQDAGWLHYLGRPLGGPAAFVPDLAGHRRGRAGQWALRLLADPRVARLDPTARLAVLAVLAWAEQPGEPFLVEPEAAARTSGLSLRPFGAAVDRACATGALGICTVLPSKLLRCVALVPGPSVRSNARGFGTQNAAWASGGPDAR
ncbi:hypothetical protein [Kitasatospora griseola]|uniref:hypothetical protein n=1 Tax=Kitasatospora griseola TaxID=2064 RepID=UPI003646753C